jgi:predicted lipid-binding transport protein (Tim44 family)
MKLNAFKSLAIIAFFGLIVIAVPQVEAKKMGSGNSVGKQSNTVTKNQNALPAKPEAAPVNAAKPATPPAAAPAAAAPSRFGGMGGILGGIAAGIGLSYLFSQMGMGGEMGAMLSNILMIAAVAFLGLWLFRKFANRNNAGGTLSTGIPGMNFPQSAAQTEQPAQWKANTAATSSNVAPAQAMTPLQQMPLMPEVSKNSPAVAGVQAHLTPNTFADKENFLVNAKNLFLQLQEASDQQNIEVLKEYTTPELFSFLRQDMLARTTAISQTQVLTLAADLIAVEEENNEFLASVRFSGTIREEANGPVEEFSEVWNWSKPMNESAGWILCGIQQLN